jgi:hypothetical protein
MKDRDFSAEAKRNRDAIKKQEEARIAPVISVYLDFLDRLPSSLGQALDAGHAGLRTTLKIRHWNGSQGPGGPQHTYLSKLSIGDILKTHVGVVASEILHSRSLKVTIRKSVREWKESRAGSGKPQWGGGGSPIMGESRYSYTKDLGYEIYIEVDPIG